VERNPKKDQLKKIKQRTGRKDQLKLKKDTKTGQEVKVYVTGISMSGKVEMANDSN
jgi:hypothetical protein